MDAFIGEFSCKNCFPKFPTGSKGNVRPLYGNCFVGKLFFAFIGEPLFPSHNILRSTEEAVRGGHYGPGT